MGQIIYRGYIVFQCSNIFFSLASGGRQRQNKSIKPRSGRQLHMALALGWREWGGGVTIGMSGRDKAHHTERGGGKDWKRGH